LAAGKQPRAPGKHLVCRDPDVIVEHRPGACEGCGADLADPSVVGTVTRQVIDLLPTIPTVADRVAFEDAPHRRSLLVRQRRRLSSSSTERGRRSPGGWWIQEFRW